LVARNPLIGILLPVAELLSLGFVLARFALVTGVPPMNLVVLPLSRVDWKAIGIGGGLLILAQLAFASVIHPLQNPDPHAPDSAWIQGLHGPFVVVAMNALLVAILAPIFEEFAFRGLLFNAFQRRMRVTTALVLTSVIFMAMHWQLHQNPWRYPLIFVMGVIFAGVYVRSQNLSTSMVLHMLNNGIIVIAAFALVLTGHGPAPAVSALYHGPAAYRVGYGTPTYFSASLDSLGTMLRNDLRDRLSTSVAFHLVPIPIANIERDTYGLPELCAQYHVHALLEPIVYQFSATQPARIDLLAVDCSGEIFFGGSRQDVQPADALRTFDQLITDFRTLTDGKQQRAWESLLRTGVPLAPDDSAYHPLFRWRVDASGVRHVIAVFRGGPADRAGLDIGDALQSMNGTVVSGASNQALSRIILRSPLLVIVAERPNGPHTITIHSKKARELVRTLGTP
jgi:membrane protease YdiL (CAAX protease family)